MFSKNRAETPSEQVDAKGCAHCTTVAERELIKPLNLLVAMGSSIGTRGGGAALGFAVNVILARALGSEQFGVYMTLLSAALLMGSLAPLGSEQVVIRETAKGAGIPYRRGGVVSWSLVRTYAAALSMLPVLFAWYWFHLHNFSTYQRIWAFVGGTATLLIMPLCMLEASILNGRRSHVLGQGLILIFQNAALLTLIVWHSVSSYKALSAGTVLLFQGIGYGVTAVLGGVLIWRIAEQKFFQYSAPRRVPIQPSPRALRRSSWSFFSTTVAAQLTSRLDVILVSVLVSGQVTGTYAIAVRLAQFALITGLAVNIVLEPRIAAVWKDADYSSVASLLKRSLRFAIPVAVAQLIFAVFVAGELTNILGASFAGARVPFIIIASGYSVWTAVAPLYSALAMTGSEKVIARLSWIILATNVVIIIAIAPHFGALGAALAMLLSYIVPLPILIGSVRSKLLIPYQRRH